MKKQEFVPESDKTEKMKLKEEEAEKMPFFATGRGKGISAFLMVIIIIVVFAVRLGSSGDIAYQMDDVQLGVTCSGASPVFFLFDKITNVELLQSFDMGEAAETLEWDSGWCGTYQNGTYGDYTLYAYSDVGIYILVQDTEKTLIFNAKKAKNTKDAYEELLNRVGNSNREA